MSIAIPQTDDDVLDLPAEVPVFPLPEAVLLPGEPMPLHIFEERYRIMTETAISSERLIVMGHLKTGHESDEPEKRDIYDVAGLGQIVMDERLNDGRFNLVLLGLKRIRIRRMLQHKPYRRAEVELLPDRFSSTNPALLHSLEDSILTLSRRLMKFRRDDIDPAQATSLNEVLKPGAVALGTLCDLAAATLFTTPNEKQMILEELDVIRRSEKVIFGLRFQWEATRSGVSSHLVH